jgi:transposase
MEKMIASLKVVELVVAVLSLVKRMCEINAELTKQLTNLRRKRPKSETLRRLEKQLELPFGQCIPPFQGEKGAERKEKKVASRKGRHPGRAAFPAHLPRIKVPNPVPPNKRICPVCGCEMETVGDSICEILEVIPARVVVLQREDETVACPHDDSIVSAPTPPQLVEKGKLGMGLIVEAVADKFLESQPIERQCARFARMGVDVAPQTLGRSVGVALDLLAPLAKKIEEKTRGPGLLGTDSTGIAVLDTTVKDGIRTGTMTCWTNADWVAFSYSPRGDSESIKAFLGDKFQRRVVQCDGSTVLNFIEKSGGKRPGCWSHARRGLVDAARTGDCLALEGLNIIKELFFVDALSRKAGDTAFQRQARRALLSRPITDKIHSWVETYRPCIPPKSPLGKALRYIHNQWERLLLFLDDGNIELTNNRRERELRRLVLGRKNWLFTWQDLGGHRTAHILSIIATCIAFEVNPRAYLHTVVKLIVEGWPQAQLEQLLPDKIVHMFPHLAVSEDQPNPPPPPAFLSQITPQPSL